MNELQKVTSSGTGGELAGFFLTLHDKLKSASECGILIEKLQKSSNTQTPYCLQRLGASPPGPHFGPQNFVYVSPL